MPRRPLPLQLFRTLTIHQRPCPYQLRTRFRTNSTTTRHPARPARSAGGQVEEPEQVACRGARCGRALATLSRRQDGRRRNAGREGQARSGAGNPIGKPTAHVLPSGLHPRKHASARKTAFAGRFLRFEVVESARTHACGRAPQQLDAVTRQNEKRAKRRLDQGLIQRPQTVKTCQRRRFFVRTPPLEQTNALNKGTAERSGSQKPSRRHQRRASSAPGVARKQLTMRARSAPPGRDRKEPGRRIFRSCRPTGITKAAAALSLASKKAPRVCGALSTNRMVKRLRKRTARCSFDVLVLKLLND